MSATAGKQTWGNLPGAALSLAIAEAASSAGRFTLLLTADSQAADRLEQELRFFAPDLPVLPFPDWETLPYDLFSPHPDIISERVAALYRLPTLKRGVLVVPVSTLLQRLAPPEWVAGNVLDLKKGQKLDLDAEKRRLQAAGYRHVPQVNDPGDFSVRGALLDLFPTGAAEPYRIELFDDTIDSLRSFDPETQRSMHPIDAIELLPAREFPLDEASCKRAREAMLDRFDVNPRRCPLVQDLKEGVAPAGIEYYLPLFFERTASLFDHVPANALVVLDTGWEPAAEQLLAQCTQRWEQRRHDIERPVLPPEDLWLRLDELRAALNRHVRIEQVPPEHPRFEKGLAFDAQPAPNLPLAAKGEAPAAALRAFLSSYPGRVLIAADSPGRREALIDVLAAADLKPPTVADWAAFLESEHRYAIGVVPLDAGFALTEPAIAVLTERQLFPEKAEQSRRRTRRGVRDPDAIIKDLSEIAVGSPIVHEEHGVGRYRGLEVLEAGGVAGEYLVIEYAKGDKLYVPVSQLERVSRYSGASTEHAPLHSLGGEAWEKARKRAADKVRDVAAELLEIQARRQARAGLALPVDRALYEPFAATFPFEETPDQLSAIEAVITDLAKPSPMDRVVCGDVGFGKTELAMRAAFKAVEAGFQVAVLVPTTVLA